MKLTPERIAEIREAEATATDGPWEVFIPKTRPQVIQSEPTMGGGHFGIVRRHDWGIIRPNDAAFIAMSRAAIPDLLADREALMDEIETMRDVCSKLVTDAIGSMERPRIFGYGHTRQEIAVVDAGDIIRALKDVVEIKIDATLTDQED
jgi:hypothetical protein